ncbi:MAG TPA: PQQ-dependent sugar dehydrogenase [Chloroflexia bacterium]|nr:PQQ-dependent sugar dehydrogenase [Chloroflexia bacterium]
MAEQRKRRLIRIGVLLLLIIVLGLNVNRVVNFIGRPFGISVDLDQGGRLISAVLPQGFQATEYARGLRAPRLLTVGPDGTVYVAEQDGGRISALPDKDHNGKAEERITVADGLDGPNSVIYYSNTLIIGEHTRVSQVELGSDGKGAGRKVLVPALPGNGSHATKTVLVGPDGRLYLSMGSTCNVCNDDDERRAAVTAYNLDGTGQKLFARGLRNAVGLALNPWTQKIWASNNGRDLMGDNVPPETVYELSEGLDAGWPRCHAGTIIDPDFGSNGACEGVAKPVVAAHAHMAPLGIAFYKDGPFPVPYNNSLYIAFHGSWNSSSKVGYKVMRVPLKDGQVSGEPEDFMTGFLRSDDVVDGRPAGVAVGQDGSLFVSDDRGGFIYRVAWAGR